jgi:hypothetical protein
VFDALLHLTQVIKMKIELPVAVSELIETLASHFNLDPDVIVQQHFVSTLYVQLHDYWEWTMENAREKRRANWLAGRAVLAGKLPIALEDFPNKFTPGWQSTFDRQVALVAAQTNVTKVEDVQHLSKVLKAWRNQKQTRRPDK